MPIQDRPVVRKVLLASTVLWLVLGAGFWAHLESLPHPFPVQAVRSASVSEASGEVIPWVNASFRLRADQAEVHRTVTSTYAYLQTLGARWMPIHLQIRYDQPQRYVVSVDRVELGQDIARSPGQVQHALLKAWVLQNTRMRFSMPVFRQNVIADVLLSLQQNGLRLRVPGSPRELSYDEEKGSTFFEQLSSLSRTCKSDWRPNELIRICNDIEKYQRPVVEEISPFSARRAVGEAIWRTVRALDSFERLRFARAWVAYMSRSNSEGSDHPKDSLVPMDDTLWAWREWAHNEFLALLPPDFVAVLRSGKRSDRIQDAWMDALKSVGLDETGELRVDLAMRMSESAFSDELEKIALSAVDSSASSVSRTAVMSVAEKHYLLPGRVPLTSADRSRLRARALIWESCETPDVRELVAFPIQAERVLVVDNCPSRQTKIRYRSYLRYGAQGFALDNPSVRFAQMHLPSLEFAWERGWLPATNFVAGLLGYARRAGVDRKLGLSEADWNPHMRAYRVLGVIEAVEWFRGESENGSVPAR